MYSVDSLYEIFESDLARRLKLQQDCPNIYSLFEPLQNQELTTHTKCYQCGARCFFTFVICQNLCKNGHVSCEQHQAQVKDKRMTLPDM
jgi:predicted ATPase with chaperone activity